MLLVMPVQMPDTAVLDVTAEAFKALGDPIRLRILQLLSQRKHTKKLSVSGIAGELGISQPNVSHHIRTLKTAGFVHCTKKDGCSYYVVSPTRLAELVSILSSPFPEGDGALGSGDL